MLQSYIARTTTPLFERNETRRVCSTDTWSSVLDWLTIMVVSVFPDC